MKRQRPPFSFDLAMVVVGCTTFAWTSRSPFAYIPFLLAVWWYMGGRPTIQISRQFEFWMGMSFLTIAFLRTQFLPVPDPPKGVPRFYEVVLAMGEYLVLVQGQYLVTGKFRRRPGRLLLIAFTTIMMAGCFQPSIFYALAVSLWCILCLAWLRKGYAAEGRVYWRSFGGAVSLSVVPAVMMALLLPWLYDKAEGLYVRSLTNPIGIGYSGYSGLGRVGRIQIMLLSKAKVLRVFGQAPPKLRGAVFNTYLEGNWNAKTIRWGERLDLREHSDKMLSLSLDVRYNLKGDLRRILLRAPEVEIEVTGPAGVHRYRIVPGMCRTGFLIQPWMADEDCFLAYYRPPAEWPPQCRVESIAIVTARNSHLQYFDETIEARVSALPPDAICRWESEGSLLSKPFSLLRATTLEKGTPNGGSIFRLDDGIWALDAHAPATLAVAIPSDVGKVRLAFGIVEGAYVGKGRTDGVEFRVLVEGADGRREAVWSRTLDPLALPSDRGTQSAEVDLPGWWVGPGRLILETQAGPNEETFWDWSYWSLIEFAER